MNFPHPLAFILEFRGGNEGGPERGTVGIESQSQSHTRVRMDLHPCDMIPIHRVTKECMCHKLDRFIRFSEQFTRGRNA